MNLLFDIKNAMLPEGIITIVILLCSVLCFTLSKEKQGVIYPVSLAGFAAALVSFIFTIEYEAFSGSFVSNSFTTLFRALIILGTMATIVLSKRYIKDFGSSKGEFYLLIMIAALGGMLLAGANDLITVFIGIETLSISSYALCGFTRFDKLSNEAALKYLIIGAASTAVMLYGFSFLYGMTGQTNIVLIGEYLRGHDVNLVMVLSLLMVFGGFCYKISAVPFHVWAPDVYQGAPVPVAAFLSVVSKIAGFAAVIRVLTNIYGSISILSLVIAVIAVLTMTVGNLLAINQPNIKRLMAYSSIAQAGYVLAGFAVLTTTGISSVIFYLIVYLFMNFGTWAAIELFISKTGKDNIDDFSGLGFRQPYVALGLTICLLSLAGIPITAGFFAKFYVFQAIMLAGFKYIWLLILTLINTIISVYYYLRVIKAMYLKPAVSDEDMVIKSRSMSSVLAVTVIAMLMIGIFASPFISLSEDTALKVEVPALKTLDSE